MITADNIMKHEFIGLDTQITQSSNKQFIGLNGTITNETKSIPKANNIWSFSLQNNKVSVDGSKIEKRSFDRLGGKV